MARFVKGDVVVLPFPFSATSGQKRRPALVLAAWPFRGGTDFLLCLITSQNQTDSLAMELLEADFETGLLIQRSYVRPQYLFAAAESLIDRSVGRLKPT